MRRPCNRSGIVYVADTSRSFANAAVLPVLIDHREAGRGRRGFGEIDRRVFLRVVVRLAEPAPSAPVQRSCSIAFCTRLPRLKSTSANNAGDVPIVIVFATEPVNFGVGVPMNTNGARRRSAIGTAFPHRRRTSTFVANPSSHLDPRKRRARRKMPPIG